MNASLPPETHSERRRNPLSRIKVGNAIWPVLIGLAVVAWLFHRDFDTAIFQEIHFTWRTACWLLLALLFMVGRDLGYMIRLRTLSRGQYTWRQAFRVIMLWEFTSAITPSAVGGTSVAVIYVHKEGISVGRSTAIVMLTSFFDELYFVIMFPLLLAVIGMENLFHIAHTGGAVAAGIITFSLVGYAVKLIWVLMLSYGFFINPRGLKWLLVKIFGLRPLRRWRHSAEKAGSDIIISSQEFKQHGFRFWGNVASSTFLSWSSRYLVANALVMAFFSISDHLLLFARQLVMWIIMLVTPTPGGSGFAEYIFTTYCSDLISVPAAMQLTAIALIVALWRLVTYYPYLAIGAIIFPRWMKRHFSRKKP